MSKYSHIKRGWREIAGRRIYFRSRAEANYARYLQFCVESKHIVSWEHEPRTFWFSGIKRGCVSYLPDFQVTFPMGRKEFHEVKGRMDAKSRTKIKRFRKYYPEENLVVIDSTWFRNWGCLLKNTIKDWE